MLGSKLNCFQKCNLATPNNESDQQKQNSGCQHYQNTKLLKHCFSLDKTVWLALVFGNSPTSQHCKTKTFFLFTEYIITFQWVSKTFCLFKPTEENYQNKTNLAQVLHPWSHTLQLFHFHYKYWDLMKNYITLVK